MANWDVPDYEAMAANELRITREAESIRAHMLKMGRVPFFEYNDRIERGYSQPLVQIHCVRHAAWQDVRLSMKGIDTIDKLDTMNTYFIKNYGLLGYAFDGTDICAIQVGNYLGALRRGGQLDEANRLRKVR